MSLFDKAKEKALKAINKEIAVRLAKGKSVSYDLEDKAKIEALQNFPDSESKSVIYSLDVKFKAIFLKAQLKKEFPKADVKARIERYSGGSAIDAWIVGEVDEKKASEIGQFYSDDKGHSDPQSDYFAYDNYVHVMCKDGGVMNSIVQIIGKEMP